MPLLPGGSTCYMCQCLGPAAVKSSLDAASSLMLGPQAQKNCVTMQKEHMHLSAYCTAYCASSYDMLLVVNVHC